MPHYGSMMTECWFVGKMKKNYENLSQFRLSSNTHTHIHKKDPSETVKKQKRESTELNWTERALNCTVQHDMVWHLLDQSAWQFLVLWLLFTFFMDITNSVSCKWKILIYKPIFSRSNNENSTKRSTGKISAQHSSNAFDAIWIEAALAYYAVVEGKRNKKNGNKNSFSMKYSMGMQIKTDSKH